MVALLSLKGVPLGKAHCADKQGPRCGGIAGKMDLAPLSAFWSGGGCRGESPAKACRQQRISEADFRVILAEAAPGALTLSASRWRRRTSNAKITDVKQFFVPRKKNRVEIFVPRETKILPGALHLLRRNGCICTNYNQGAQLD